jgi:Tfp pilus assembly protein PilZ
MTYDPDSSRTPPLLRDALVLSGDLPAEAVRAVRRAAIAAELDVLMPARDLPSFLDAVREPSVRAVFFDMSSPHARAICTAIREDPRGARVPLLGVIGAASENVFSDLFAWGADDLVVTDTADDLLARVRTLCLALSHPSAQVSVRVPGAAAESAAGEQKDRRTSLRIECGMRAWLRPAGGERDTPSYLTNLGTSGVFVRTLHPLEVGQEVWLELTPPRSSRRVRLTTVVAWRRSRGPADAGPPGVGLRVIGGMPGDWERFREALERYSRERDLNG